MSFQHQRMMLLLIVYSLCWRPVGGRIAVDFRPKTVWGAFLYGGRLLAAPMAATGAVHLQYNVATGKIERIPVAKEKIVPSQSPLHFPKQAAPAAKRYVF